MSEQINIHYENDGFITMKRWLENRNEGKTFVDYFKQCHISNIAIYGVGDLGKLLYTEIKNKINVSYFVDRNAEGLKVIDNVPVITIDKVIDMPKVDIIVITPIFYFESICKDLVKINPAIRTLSLKEAVYEF